VARRWDQWYTRVESSEGGNADRRFELMSIVLVNGPRPNRLDLELWRTAYIASLELVSEDANMALRTAH